MHICLNIAKNRLIYQNIRTIMPAAGYFGVQISLKNDYFLKHHDKITPFLKKEGKKMVGWL